MAERLPVVMQLQVAKAVSSWAFDHLGLSLRHSGAPQFSFRQAELPQSFAAA
jgi:hypothetical protein